ncbi:MAG TPA: capsule assembly Wzi family protein [Kofleriaceae bacterium]|nr:capsule assembly Wzi family protein [Kofleriaceae bacterium]
MRGGGLRLALASALVAGAAMLAEAAADASPGVDLNDPAYDELAAARAAGALSLYMGGLRPLTEARIQALRRAAGLPDGLLDGRRASEAGRRGWLVPVRSLTMRAAVARDHQRPYSTEDHPRDLIGGVAITCEHRQGRSCGDGAGLEVELESAAGLGEWAAAVTRVRAVAGSGDRDADVVLDRAYASAELGPVALVVGRDAIVLGPSARTQALWGDNVAAIDQVRVSTSRPLPLVGRDGSILRASGLWFLGRLRDPQTFTGTLVDGSRAQLDLWDTAELGVTHLIQLGGDGAPAFTFGDYLREHFQHNAESGEFANHRLSIDAAVDLPDLAGLRIYYELAAEDMRDQIGSMLRHDADHVVGVSLARLAPRAGLLLEATSTGVRSEEHSLFTTGLTSAGRVAGNPLGPSSLAAFAGLRLDLGAVVAWPWVEVVRHSEDIYSFGTGDIVRTADLPEETRLRAGARASWQLSPELRAGIRALAERVTTADFIPGHTRWNGAAEATLEWTPTWRIATDL